MNGPSQPSPLRVYAYTALYAGSDLERDLEAIAAVSRKNNVGQGVTGALIFDRGRFIQVVEGPPDYIGELVGRIRLDTRIAEWTPLFDQPTFHRSMVDWSMQVLRTDARPGLPQATLEAFRTQYLRAFKVDAVGFLHLLVALIQS
jgi:hypothetical protein